MILQYIYVFIKITAILSSDAVIKINGMMKVIVATWQRYIAGGKARPFLKKLRYNPLPYFC